MSDTEAPPIEGRDPAEESNPTDTANQQAEHPEPEVGDEKPEPQSKLDRRIAAMSARLTAAEQNAQRAWAELERVRQASPLQPEPEISPEVRAAAERLASQMREQERGREKAENFHDAGKAAYADWQERCSNLMSMGADAGIAEILVDMKDGAKVAGALADDPEALERIAGIKTERGRAISLGMYAAQLAEQPATPARKMPRAAPPPIRPVTNLGNGNVAVPQAMTPDQLVDYYSREAMAKRGL